MREAFGGAFTIKLMLIFLAIYIAFIAVALNYAKAFRVKNKIIDIIKKKKEGNNKDNLLERKEVEFVSSRDRKKGVKVEKKEKKTKSNNNESKSKSKKKIKVNIKPTRSRDNREKKKSIGDKKGIGKKALTIILGLAIFGVFAAMAFMIYIVKSKVNFEQEA